MKLKGLMVLVVACTGFTGCEWQTSEQVARLNHLSGGQMTTERQTVRSFVAPGRELSASQKLQFWTGFSLFRDPWVTAPSSTTDRDGLGPLFNTRSCISCHAGAGAGNLPDDEISGATGLVARIGAISADNPLPDPNYGVQIQPFAIPLYDTARAAHAKGEGKLSVAYQMLPGKYPDGSEYELRSPVYHFEQLAYGPIAEHVRLSPRLAPPIIGTGLLDAIADKDLLAQEDPEDLNDDGISGRYNRVPDLASGNTRIGRFGHKAGHPNLRQQVAAAFRDDMGITNTLYPLESCATLQKTCRDVARLVAHSGVEIPDKLLAVTVDFVRYLGVPPAVNLTRRDVLKGQALFGQAACGSCHTPSYVTAANYPASQLANQTIFPYTDLALHHMGDELSDGSVEHNAIPGEWRTPPLWGIGLRLQLNPNTGLLHDGRARNVEEAILWHGGEGAQARQQFMSMTRAEREALVQFILSV